MEKRVSSVELALFQLGGIHMKILLLIGHSILKNGNCTSADGRTKGGCLEYNWCKAFSKQLKKELENNGHKVKRVVCPEKVFKSKSEENKYKLDIEKAEDYDLVLELHLNASDNKTANGTEVIYTSKKGKEYAEAIQKQLSTVFRDRGTKKREDLYILNQTKAVAVVLETFFCTCKNDYKKANGEKKRIKLAKLVVNGIDSVGEEI